MTQREKADTVRVKPFELAVTELKGSNPGDSVYWGWTMAYRPTGEYAAKAYCFGGMTGIHDYSGDTWVLNAVDKADLKWDKLEPQGKAHACYFATSGLVENNMIVFGGMSNVGWKNGSKLKSEEPTGHLQVLDLASKEWTVLLPGP